MNMSDLKTRGLAMLGCGKMGSAMLEGWLAGALEPGDVWVMDPNPSEWLQGTGVHINEGLPDAPAMLLVAVKPQMMGDALPTVTAHGNGDTVVLSVAAGVTIAAFEDVFGADTPVIRAMPNTPAAVGRGITALVANDKGQATLDLAADLLDAVGQTVRLESEDQMDAVTAVSGSGPAYVFHMIECLAKAGEAQGLDADLAMALAKATVGGAGQLAEDSPKDPGTLRSDVTSPNGTTQAGLEVLMADLPDLMHRTVTAAAERSRELGK
ncbi:Pyrroline-5-carboxylate reductase [Rhodobacteraceae bacterium THAF1]|uniref:pyrroline-5-carboxylate reductase n=1 Tax=Palleronia sp. THAF1 TaxID=2587842 RepID=UPI000F3DFD95|nr:pyrroline-5-carboxylate reductase [Palleronia sp. THAF1]QFU07354.1 Pyrroline-5-carboxylate reductase [Palleronia sp. THAF1]VDC20734.1 Pyrroline-5-carboxylate reductase [Rhodobacteraceae bacterium THAF1]